MKIGIGKMVLVLVILSTGLTSLVTPAPGTQATITTSKHNYELGEDVVFTLKNTGTTTIGFGAGSWGIDKLTGGKWTRINLGFQVMILWFVDPNESYTWEWGQWSADPNLIVDAGIYRVVVYNESSAIFTIGDKDSDGLPDTVDGCKYSFGRIYNKGCPFTPYSIFVTTSKRNYDLGEPVSFTLTNKGTTPITCNVNNPWEIEKLSGGKWTYVYSRGIAWENWTLPYLGTRTWEWGQNSITPTLIVDAGIYRVVVSISGKKWSAIFTIGDKDSDGLPDTVDGCPTYFGRIYNNGCTVA